MAVFVRYFAKGAKGAGKQVATCLPCGPGKAELHFAHCYKSYEAGILKQIRSKVTCHL